jgi:hypothetical protein
MRQREIDLIMLEAKNEAEEIFREFVMDLLAGREYLGEEQEIDYANIPEEGQEDAGYAAVGGHGSSPSSAGTLPGGRAYPAA